MPKLCGVRRGLLGGTFDPPHLAHLRAGEAAYHQLGLDVVTFMPAGTPWHKSGRPVTAADHRWQMTCLAAEPVEYFEADRREVSRPGWTYTVDTLETFPDDEDVCLILGADAAANVQTWHRWRDVLDRVTLAVVPRPGTEGAEVTVATGGAHVWLDTAKLNVSGSMIRALAARGRSYRFLVPEAVWRYGEEHHVYDGSSLRSDAR
ncbi:MAG: nicotinate-nucleotide adenylyltransferase [Acidimicrobiia bacterium]